MSDTQVTADDDDPVRVRKLKRALRIVLPVTGLLYLATIVSIPAMPWLLVALVIPDVAGLVAVYLLDKAIIDNGGQSFWKDGRFRG